ncbi:MAG TPA: hypothetical protein VN626_10855 [Clostridia bacterium]|nr:hypothetical protein [Clostridia bacterium]
MFKSKLFGNNITPSCSYCEYGTFTQDQSAILCSRRGVVTPEYACRKFIYDPLSRVPKPQPKLTKFDPGDFKL